MIGNGSSVGRIGFRFKLDNACLRANRLCSVLQRVQQIGNGGNVQLRQLIAIAGQRPHFLIVTQIQRRQLVVKAVQRHHFRVLAHVQRRQLIAGAVQSSQFRVPGHVQRSQLIAGTVQAD